MLRFWHRRIERWRNWFRTPPKPWERVLICVAATFYFGVIGALLPFFFMTVPLIPLEALVVTLLKWALPTAAVAGVFAYRYPKAMLCVVYPLALFGIGDVQLT